MNVSLGKRAEIDSNSTPLDRLMYRVLGIVFMAAALYALLVATKQVFHRWTASTATPNRMKGVKLEGVGSGMF